MFVEMSEELAKLRGIKNGEKVKVASVRGEVELRGHGNDALPAVQARRLIVHQVGMPWCFGWLVPQGWRRKRESAHPQRGRSQHHDT